MERFWWKSGWLCVWYWYWWYLNRCWEVSQGTEQKYKGEFYLLIQSDSFLVNSKLVSFVFSSFSCMVSSPLKALFFPVESQVCFILSFSISIKVFDKLWHTLSSCILLTCMLVLSVHYEVLLKFSVHQWISKFSWFQSNTYSVFDW